MNTSMSLINKLKTKLIVKKNIFFDNISKLFKNKIDENFFESLTTLLINADVGISTTDKIIMLLKKEKGKTEVELKTSLAHILYNILKPREENLKTIPSNPFVILVVGVNGVGKTTTIGKLAHIYKNKSKKVLVAAGDTFRAAGIEQLAMICEKENIPIIKQHHGSDSTAVIFDAFKTAQAKKFDILIADTSGRLHTNDLLMSDLKKIKMVLKKLNKNAPHEIMMVIDATFGQNSLNQIKKFHSYLNLTGLTISKMDGTAKAGIIFTMADTLNIPIRYIGYGEKMQDLKIFNSKVYINKLLQTNI